MSGLQFRCAGPEDVRAIVALVHRAYRETGLPGWTTEAELLGGQRTDADEVLGLVRGADSRILLAERNGELVASVALACSRGVVSVGMLAVQPALQAQGLGRALLAEVERMVRAERLGTRLQMTVIAQRSELIAWYERRGYRVTAATQPFPYGQPRFGLPRRPDLYFRVLTKELGGDDDGA